MRIAIDTETGLILPGVLAPPLVCVTFARFGVDGSIESGILHHSDPDVMPFLLSAFREHETVFQNAPFDLAVFMEWATMRGDADELIEAIVAAVDEGRVLDTMIREQLIDLGLGRFRWEEDEEGNAVGRPYSLDAISERRLGRKKQFDQWRLRYHDLHDVPLDRWPADAKTYALTDAVLTLQVSADQDREAVNLHDEQAQNAAHLALHLASSYGLKTEPSAIDDLESRIVARVESCRADLIAEGLVREDDTRDTKAAVRRMISACVERGLDVPFTNKGVELRTADLTERDLKDLRKSSAGEEFIETRSPETLLRVARDLGKFVSVAEDACNESGDEVLKKYSLYTRSRNLLTGSVKHLKQGQVVPVQTRFTVLMETGRTSSSSPNVQNVRREPGVRECFVPRPGHVFVGADYSAAELHTLAQACLDLVGESNLAVALNNGIDPHLWVASLILAIEYEEAAQRYRDKDATVKNARQLAKAANFGFPGGCSARRFTAIAAGYTDANGNALELDEHEAQVLRAKWFRAWPEMKLYFDHVSGNVDARGWHIVEQPRTNRIRRRCTYTSACNSNFQGLAADAAKRALWDITRAQLVDRSSALWGSAIVNFVHDEIIIETPTSRAHDAALELESRMERAFESLCPDVPARAEAVVMRFWSKSAERIVGDDGRLQPWPQLH